ncbi:MAG TPA: 4-(cytidine 5'-diphospho)-2-C-methyl-D-erythritol kinase [Spirochaetota bacterium]
MRRSIIHCERAHAKVNLHLEVLHARTDGYHNLLSVMASVGLHDLLKLYEFELVNGVPGEVEMTIEREGGKYASILEGVPVEKNLITKAARKYMTKVGKAAKIVIGITKNIPAGGGLGGGSADAAAMLRLLDISGDEKLGPDMLRTIACEVGADVPFCVTGGLSICEGIGDIIEDFFPLNGLTILLANNGLHVDTAAAYRLIDQSRPQGWASPGFRAKKDKLRLACERSIKDIIQMSVNDFEVPVFNCYPAIADLKNRLLENGAIFSMMTGSGSTVFGLFDNFEIAESARKSLCDEGIQVELTEFVSSVKY